MMEKGWKETSSGGLVDEAGNSTSYETGAWRTFRPIIDMEKCIHCMFCWLYCPDGSILVENSKVIGIDLKHCKGCGICAAECPKKVITMVEETLAKEAARV